MSKAQLLLTLVFLFLCAYGAAAQSDGTIVEQAACPPDSRTYEQYVEAAKRISAGEVEAAKQEGFRLELTDAAERLLSREEFQRRKAFAGFECLRIKYLSDGLKVVGYIWKPKNTKGKKFPLIIYNRGGSREGGKLSAWQQYGPSFGLYPYVTGGFVVIGSQYRGVDGGEGREEFGGAEVNDVSNLIPLAKSLGYVDLNNVFMLGWSRGGMETYLALKKQIGVKAVAVTSGLTDLVALAKRRPQVVANPYRQLIPGFDKHGEEAMRERSAVYWADKINVPLLIMHGGADWRLDLSSQVLAFAQKLQELGKTYELIIYAGDNHGVALNREDADRRTIEWFKKFIR